MDFDQIRPLFMLKTDIFVILGRLFVFHQAIFAKISQFSGDHSCQEAQLRQSFRPLSGMNIFYIFEGLNGPYGATQFAYT